jgi:hypothetical protein
VPVCRYILHTCCEGLTIKGLSELRRLHLRSEGSVFQMLLAEFHSTSSSESTTLKTHTVREVTELRVKVLPERTVKDVSELRVKVLPELRRLCCWRS